MLLRTGEQLENDLFHIFETVELVTHNKNLQILYSYFTIYYLEVYTKFSTHPIKALYFQVLKCCDCC